MGYATPEWQATRADYLQRLRARMDSDPDYAERMRLAHRQAAQRWLAALDAEPVRLAAYRARKAAWWRSLAPGRREANQAWYAGLSREERVLYYYEARAARALERRQALADELVRRRGGVVGGDDAGAL